MWNWDVPLYVVEPSLSTDASPIQLSRISTLSPYSDHHSCNPLLIEEASLWYLQVNVDDHIDTHSQKNLKSSLMCMYTHCLSTFVSLIFTFLCEHRVAKTRKFSSPHPLLCVGVTYTIEGCSSMYPLLYHKTLCKVWESISIILEEG